MTSNRLFLEQTYALEDGHVLVVGASDGSLLTLDTRKLINQVMASEEPEAQSDREASGDVGDVVAQPQRPTSRTANKANGTPTPLSCLQHMQTPSRTDAGGRVVGLHALHTQDMDSLCVARKHALQVLKIGKDVSTPSCESDDRFSAKIQDEITVFQEVSCTALDQEHGRLFVGGTAGELQLFDIDSGKPIATSRLGKTAINSLSYSRGVLCCCTEDHELVILDPQSLKPIKRTPAKAWRQHNQGKRKHAKRTIPNTSSWLSAVDVHPDGSFVVCGGTEGSFLFAAQNLDHPVAELVRPASSSTVTSVKYIEREVFVANDTGVVRRFCAGEKTGSMQAPDSLTSVFSIATNSSFAPPPFKVVSCCGTDDQVALSFGPPFSIFDVTTSPCS